MADLRDLDINHKISEIKRLIYEKKAPNGWTIGPSSHPKNLGKLLEEEGFSNVYHQTSMAINLKNLRFNGSDLGKYGVKLIKNEKLLQSWVKIVSSVFNIKVNLKFLKNLFHDKNSHFYLGFHEGEIVSSLLMFNSSGVAGLHAVSTLPKYRNKGFGAKISGCALIDGFEMGYKMAVLHASDMGMRVYQKLGFDKYGDIYSYELP